MHREGPQEACSQGPDHHTATDILLFPPKQTGLQEWSRLFQTFLLTQLSCLPFSILTNGLLSARRDHRTLLVFGGFLRTPIFIFSTTSKSFSFHSLMEPFFFYLYLISKFLFRMLSCSSIICRLYQTYEGE